MNNNINFEEEGDKFLNLFKQLEKAIEEECQKVGIETYHKEISYLINKLSEKNNIVKKHKNELDLIREVRNTNTHNIIGKSKYVVYPSPEINIRLENIIDEIKKPPMIYDSSICIKRQAMYCRTLKDSIYDTIKEMTKKLYTHVPILENEKLVGIFSENTLLDIVNIESGIIIDEMTSFSDIKNAIKIENHSMEDFEFISRRKNIYDVENMFKDYFSRNKRLGCVYITQNGNKNENILGMLTAWDVLGG